jgi:predicted ATPase with chaperone activity
VKVKKVKVKFFFFSYLQIQESNKQKMGDITHFFGELFEDVKSRPLSAVTPAVLFYVLSPGRFLIVPGAERMIEMSLVNQNEKVLITHSLIFTAVYLVVKKLWPQYYSL